MSNTASWVTTGYGHGPDGQWIELGHIDGVVSIPPPMQPEINLGDVAAKLNSLEASRNRWKSLVSQLRGNIYRLWEQATDIEKRATDEDAAPQS